jgi:DNA polymerase III alpha subunit
MIASVRYTFTRKDNRKMAMLTLEDLTGKSDAVVFPRTFDQVGELLRGEAMVFVTGTVDWRRERANIIVSDVIPIDKAIPQLTGRMVLRLTAQRAGREFLTQLRGLLEKHHGEIPLLFELTPTGRIDVRATIRADERWGVAPSRELLDELGEHLEQQDIVLVPKGEGNPSSSARGAYRRSGTYPRTRRRANTSVSVTGYD